MIPETSQSQYKRQAKIAGVTAAAVKTLVNRLGSEFEMSWSVVRGEAATVLQAGLEKTVSFALPYISDVLAETGQESSPQGELVEDAFTSSLPDGRSVESLLDEVPIKAKTAVANGLTVAEAVRQTSRWATGTVLTVLGDVRRSVYAADIAQNSAVTGYVRMLNPPSCARCVQLAGKWFRWNQGFQRHPRCDCIHIPSTENLAGSYLTDPYEYFNGLSEAEQDRLFGKNDAYAIRQGADMNRVLNTRMRGLGTVKGNRLYGTPNKRTIDDILARDPSRKYVVENLKYHGYITGPQTVQGNILGNGRERFAGMSRGVGTVVVGGRTVKTARASVVDARVSGVRDPLNRATMTAAERRLYDAWYRWDFASRTGTIPNTVGLSSADIYTINRTASAAELARLRAEFDKQLAVAADRSRSPESVRILASLLQLK